MSALGLENLEKIALDHVKAEIERALGTVVTKGNGKVRELDQGLLQLTEAGKRLWSS